MVSKLLSNLTLSAESGQNEREEVHQKIWTDDELHTISQITSLLLGWTVAHVHHCEHDVETRPFRLVSRQVF